MVLLSIGKASYEITVPMEDFPVENTKTVIKEKLEGSGGSALNVAYLLGKWNTDTYFAGIVGYDDIGSSIKKELETSKVHTTFMEINYEKKTTTNFILVNKKKTTRTQLMIEPEAYHLKKYEYDISPNIIYGDGYEYSATLAAYNKFPNAISVLGAGLNVSDPKEIEALAKYAKYVIFSFEFACSVTKMSVELNDPSGLLKLYKELKEKYPHSTNIVTLHNMGVLYAKENEIKVMPTIKVEEIDRTGAGDIFDGAFVYGLGKGYDLEKCLRLANIAGALSTTKYGGKASIPILSDVIHKYETQFGSLDAKIQNEGPTTTEEVPSVNEPKINEVENKTVETIENPSVVTPVQVIPPTVVAPTIKEEFTSENNSNL